MNQSLTRIPLSRFGKSVVSFDDARNALNYRISKEPIRSVEHSDDPPSTFRGLYNANTRRMLATCKEGFTFIQPSESLEAMETAVQSVGALWSSVASLAGGAQIYAFADLPDRTIVAPKRGDRMGISFGYCDYFDGSGYSSFPLFGNVLQCTNGMVAREAIFSARVKHTVSMPERIAGIRFNFAMKLQNAVESMQATVTKLDETPMTRSEVNAFSLRLFGVENESALRDPKQTATRTVNKVEAIRTGFVRGTGNRGQTRWDAFNAVTEYLDWSSTFRETAGNTLAENRFSSLVAGNAASVREHALELLLN